MTNTIISSDVLKYVLTMIENTYSEYNIEDIVFLLNTCEEDFYNAMMTVANKNSNKGRSVLSITNCDKQDFVNTVMSCDNIAVGAVVQEDVKTYRVKQSNMVIESHLVDRFRSVGVEIVESIENREYNSVITLFWTE